MEKITLQPGVWTQVFATQFIQSKSNQSGLRVYYGPEAPAVDTDAYFLTAEFDRKPFPLPEGILSSFVYLMPDEDMPIDVVVF
ncbi:hypothetical protein [Rhizobium sp. BK661]|uniref:hypothetical protein n=1 Tax=Rhizobium sp. BK661 TaxID=2586991 RepID=UPI002168D80D|nr:hypothetical protein [Rhizobium sp. BK661]MCS3740233.1 hypothetical protein [Rhizobium sp. BK661]